MEVREYDLDAEGACELVIDKETQEVYILERNRSNTDKDSEVSMAE